MALGVVERSHDKSFKQLSNLELAPKKNMVFCGGMFGETTILFCVKMWNHPTETTTKNWMVQVPGLKTVAPFVESIATMHF